MTIGIWICALLSYLAFRFWYDGIRRPLSPEEVEHFVGVLKKRASEGLDQQDLAVIQQFMEEDDGQEFIMVNLVQFNSSPVIHPSTGREVEAAALLQEYFKPLMKTFLRRAGHPVLGARVVGGYIESWNTPPDPGWNVAGLIRYRSRRDAILASLADSEFDGIHQYKIAALRQTFVLPTQKMMGLYASPRLTVGLVLALGACILQRLVT